MKKELLFLITIAVILFTGCRKYPKGDGAAVFFICKDCVSNVNLYIYVDGEKLDGFLEKNYYNVVCGPPCPEDESSSNAYPSYIGPAGIHTFEVKSLTGTVYQTGTFTIEDQGCEKIQIFPSGCFAGNGGGGSGGGGLPSNYENQGTIIVHSLSLSICMRDFATIDGDVIDLVINGQTVLANKEVTGTDQCYNLTLQSTTGNWIGVIAKNEGSIPPCTPGITINDGFSSQTFEIRSYVGGVNGAYIIQVN